MLGLFAELRSSQMDDGEVLASVRSFPGVVYAHYAEFPRPLYDPGDPRLGDMYYLSLLDMYNAWDISMGDSTVIVGIIDTGIDLTNPDIAPRLAYNWADPIDGVDNDQDGFVDNFVGWDMAQNDNDATAVINSHGAGVAGIVAATAGNGYGGAGIAPGVKVLPVKVMDDQGVMRSFYEGIVYAAQHGCKIINCSWGGIIPTPFGQDIIDYVTNDLGCLVVASAGNSRDCSVHYPAGYRGVASVVASNAYDHKWEGSTYGFGHDLAAPGERILSSGMGGAMAYTHGTSNAAPMVAGSAALVSSIRPHLTGAQLLAQLKATAYGIDTLAANLPYQHRMGEGRLNPLHALIDSNTFYFDIPQNIINASFVDPGTTVPLTAVATNLLRSQNAVGVTITPLESWASISAGALFLPQVFGGQSVVLSDYGVSITLSPDAPLDAELPVRFSVVAGGRTQNTIRVVRTAPSWVDISDYEMCMTLCADGTPAYHSYAPMVGNGFRKGNSGPLLWTSGLVFGDADGRVATSLDHYSDFVPLSPATLTTATGEQRAVARFTDAGLPIPMGLEVRVVAATGGEYPLSEAILYHVAALNTGNDTLRGFRAGMFASWLIDEHGFVSFDAPLGLATAFDTAGAHPFAHGLAVISPADDITNYAFDFSATPQGIDMRDGLSRPELAEALRASHAAPVVPQGEQPVHLLACDLGDIAPGDTAHVIFAFLTDSHAGLLAGHTLVLRDHPLSMEGQSASVLNCYPNPAHRLLFVSADVSQAQLFDLSGRLRLSAAPREGGLVDIGTLPAGVYLVRLTGLEGARWQKVAVAE